MYWLKRTCRAERKYKADRESDVWLWENSSCLIWICIKNLPTLARPCGATVLGLCFAKVLLDEISIFHLLSL